jgi:hypothetical protein
MSHEGLRTFLLCAVILLPLVVYLVWRERTKRLEQRRRIEWMKLCRRLELRPREEKPEVASGRQHGAEIELRDTRSLLFMGLRLPQPLLPPGVLLLSERAAEHHAGPTPRPLQLREHSPRPGAPGWYATPEAAAGDVEVSQEFLGEAEHAAQAHPALGVESDWLFQALPAPSLPDPREVRGAVQALQRTGERLLEVVKAHGLPRLEVPAPPQPAPPVPTEPASVHFFEPSAPSSPATEPPPPLPRRLMLTLSDGNPWIWLLCINGGAPFALLSQALKVDWLITVTGILYFVGILAVGSYRSRKGRGHLGALALPAILASFFAPSAWLEAEQLRNASFEDGISVRDVLHRPEVFHLRLRDGTARIDLAGHAAAPGRNNKGQTITGYFSAYPIVPEGWTPQEPVTVWATRNPPPEGPLEGFRVRNPGYYADAADAAAQEHGLINHPHAVYVNLLDSVGWQIERLETKAGFLWTVPNLIWLVAALVFWLSEFKRLSRPQPRGASPEMRRA